MRIPILPGDGIGPEITDALAVLGRADALWRPGSASGRGAAGFLGLRRHGSTFRKEPAAQCPDAAAALG